MNDSDINLKNIKSQLILYKKFTNFYKNKFIPITIYEEQDRIKTLKRFEYSRIIGYVIAFLTANNINKIKSFFLKKNLLPTNFFSLFLKSFIFGMFGFVLAHCISLKIFFNHTEYIRLRLYYEKSIKFDRKNVKRETLYEDYPFAHKATYLYNDLEIRNKLKKKKPSVDKNIIDHGEDSVIKKHKRGVFTKDNANNTIEDNDLVDVDNLKRDE